MQSQSESIESRDLQDQSIAGYSSSLGFTEIQTARIVNFRTSSGFEFPEIEIAYMTLGQLSPARDNVVLICHALSGSAHVAGMDRESGRPGWWDYHVGPGKTIDTDRFYVIATNVLGGCSGSTGPASIDPRTGQRYAMRFPPVTIRDMVRAQAALMDQLGIERVFAAIGGSMGGMQAMTWTVDYPERIGHAVVIASCMAHSAMQIAFNEVGRQAIFTDPDWQGGAYYDAARPEHGLAVARMVGHVTYLSEYSMHTKFGRRLQRPATPEDLFPAFFSVESYLHHQGESFVRRFDPNSYLYITKALDMFDILEGQAPAAVFTGGAAEFLVVSFESDWLYPPSQSREMVRALKRSNRSASYVNLSTPYGHDSFLIENPAFNRIVSNYLQQNYSRQPGR
ncbi:MAG: homoserine O-acetyltransferase [Leptospirales bacterium]|nr:homoserine O-acetyltransferase [Leptospirales bacterium]